MVGRLTLDQVVKVRALPPQLVSSDVAVRNPRRGCRDGFVDTGSVCPPPYPGERGRPSKPCGHLPQCARVVPREGLPLRIRRPIGAEASIVRWRRQKSGSQGSSPCPAASRIEPASGGRRACALRGRRVAGPAQKSGRRSRRPDRRRDSRQHEAGCERPLRQESDPPRLHL
jgi:hypothetical protein